MIFELSPSQQQITGYCLGNKQTHSSVLGAVLPSSSIVSDVGLAFLKVAYKHKAVWREGEFLGFRVVWCFCCFCGPLLTIPALFSTKKRP